MAYIHLSRFFSSSKIVKDGSYRNSEHRVNTLKCLVGYTEMVDLLYISACMGLSSILTKPEV